MTPSASAASISPEVPRAQVPAPAPLRLTLGEVCEATGARIVTGDATALVGAIDIDSRRLQLGDWFLAHAGSSVDGHDYLESAREGGIAGAIVTHPEALRAGWDLPTLAVDDHVAFLARLGTLIRARFTGPVVGITGSVGKTTCKHVLAHLSSVDRAVLATPWNWNTEVGVPLTLSQLLREGADVLVLELAMRGPGQIRELTEIALPSVGILTAIAPVHLEILGSLWNILAAKLELFASMAPGGTWVYPAPDPAIRNGIAALPASPHAELRFLAGLAMDDPRDPALLHAANPRFDHTRGGWDLTLRYQHQEVAAFLPAISMSQIWSSLAAVGGALALGVPLDACAQRLAAVPPITGRMELKSRFPRRTILFDCYNSNPLSAADALETLARVAQGHSTVAILGGMKELGVESERYHRELGSKARALGVDQVMAVGAEADWIAAGASGGSTQVYTADRVEDLESWLGTQIGPDAVVLLKGSRAYHLESVLEMEW